MKQKTLKPIPLDVPFDYSGSFNKVIDDFINAIKKVTGGDVEIHCDLIGNVTIYYEETHPSIKPDSLYPSKINESSANKNDLPSDDCQSSKL